MTERGDGVVARVEAFLLHERFVFVRVESTDGAVGWGECSFHGGATTAGLVERLAPLVVGTDAFATTKLWWHLFQDGYRLGSTGAHIAALAGIDIALWDLKGRILGVPIADLIGGRLRDEIPVYSSMMSRTRAPTEHADHTQRRVDDGFRAVKIHTGVHWARGEAGTADADRTVAAVAEIRDKVGGPEVVEVFVDVNQTYDVTMALRVGRVLEGLDVGWLEEPLAPWDIDGYRRLTDHLDLPIAAGEQAFNLREFRDLVERAGITILQPNVTTCGGFTPALQIAAMADANGTTIACHNTSPALATAAHLQFAAVTPACRTYLEWYGESHHPLWTTPVLRAPLQPVAGVVTVPTGPGLGVDVDEAAVRSLATPLDTGATP